MELAHRWGDRNLTKLELVIALTILTLLIGVFSHYSLIILSQAERSMINRTVININTALNVRASLAVMKGNFDELSILLNTNPMESMNTRLETDSLGDELTPLSLTLIEASVSSPANYGGVLLDDNSDVMEKGKWYYVKNENLVVYTLVNRGLLADSNKDRIRFKIILDYNDKNSNGVFDSMIDEFNSIKLKPIDNYTSGF